MINVLEEIKNESEEESGYPDEKIASNIYLISLSYALRALDRMKEEEREKHAKENAWLERETPKVHEVPVLGFDQLVKKSANGKRSCDCLFYHFVRGEGRQHYLAEMKDADKKTVLHMLDDKGADGIYGKVSDSVQMIKSQLAFGGAQEHEELIAHTHFFLVYGGKNNVPAREPVRMVKRTRVSRDQNGKQRKAGRMPFDSEKKENETLERFGVAIQKLGLECCAEDTFPGDALPRAKRGGSGKNRVRAFSLFSAHDFSQILMAGFFDDWDWGDYQEYFA